MIRGPIYLDFDCIIFGKSDRLVKYHKTLCPTILVVIFLCSVPPALTICALPIVSSTNVTVCLKSNCISLSCYSIDQVCRFFRLAHKLCRVLYVNNTLK